MTCAEFQKVLPFMFEGGEVDAAATEHLNTCPSCADLVADLRYIADQAKLLLPLHDPSPKVWTNIEESLEREGLSGPSRIAGPGRVEAVPSRSRMPGFAWAAAAAAALLVAGGLYLTSKPALPATDAVNGAPNQSALARMDDSDQQVLTQVETVSPALRKVYEKNLQEVNTYIAEAKSSVEQDPDDRDAREHLREAYAQKAILYEMATARSFE